MSLNPFNPLVIGYDNCCILKQEFDSQDTRRIPLDYGMVLIYLQTTISFARNALV